MTPLHLDILIHYYVSCAEFREIPQNTTQTDYAYELAKRGLLFTPKDFGEALQFGITIAGKKKVDDLLKELEKL